MITVVLAGLAWVGIMVSTTPRGRRLDIGELSKGLGVFFLLGVVVASALGCLASPIAVAEEEFVVRQQRVEKYNIVCLLDNGRTVVLDQRKIRIDSGEAPQGEGTLVVTRTRPMSAFREGSPWWTSGFTLPFFSWVNEWKYYRLIVPQGMVFQ